jgi:hypothetical protein
MDMAKHRRKTKKKIAVALITAMAETDGDYAFIAKRLGETPENIKQWIVGLIDGETRAMDEVSDLLLALGCELNFGLRAYQEPMRPGTEQKAEAA